VELKQRLLFAIAAVASYPADDECGSGERATQPHALGEDSMILF